MLPILLEVNFSDIIMLDVLKNPILSDVLNLLGINRTKYVDSHD